MNEAYKNLEKIEVKNNSITFNLDTNSNGFIGILFLYYFNAILRTIFF